MTQTNDTHPMQQAATLRLLAAALELQHLTGLAANMVPIQGDERVIVVGNAAQAMDLLAAQIKPAEPTTLPEDVAALFSACGFEIRSTDPAENHPFAVCGSLDAAGLVVEKLLVNDQTRAALDVLAERRRQVEAEGMTNEGDDGYQAAELPRAAASYILNGANDAAPYIWPWAKSWWKPRDARANYVRAAALLLAEIERIDRAAACAQEGGAS